MTSMEATTELIYRTVPYPHQVQDLDFTSESDALRFTWRGTRYRVRHREDVPPSVEESRNGCLCGSDVAILMEALLKRGWIQYIEGKQ